MVTRVGMTRSSGSCEIPPHVKYNRIRSLVLYMDCVTEAFEKGEIDEKGDRTEDGDARNPTVPMRYDSNPPQESNEDDSPRDTGMRELLRSFATTGGPPEAEA